MHPSRPTAFCLMLSVAASVATAALAQPVVPPADPAVKRGVDLWGAGDYPGAVSAWRAPAAAGDADAQFNMAQAYKLGRGVPADQRAAESWYRRAAEQGHREAQGAIGVIMFQNGDRAGALPWLLKASDTGDARAQYLYGTALFNGENVGRDWPRAYALMTRAAAAGLPQATATLRQMDQFIPLLERQQGLKLAARFVPGAASAASSRRAVPIATATPHAPPAPTPPAPAPRTTDRTTPRPAATPAPTGRWRIQVGAYRTEPAARAAWTALRTHAPTLAGLSPAYRHAGPVVRLQLGGFADRPAAARACAAARVAGCFPVAG